MFKSNKLHVNVAQTMKFVSEGQKTLWGKEKMLAISIFSLSNIVIKSSDLYSC